MTLVDGYGFFRLVTTDPEGNKCPEDCRNLNGRCRLHERYRQRWVYQGFKDVVVVDDSHYTTDFYDNTRCGKTCPMRST